ncbi:excinuclease ABC subunit UvrA [Alphaproteobacteria bacterium]|nr:excinuclease ABC subunit UvrA [Alphaproteobacteria bacterium]
MAYNKSINSNYLEIIGASENNLKNINLKLPKNKLIIFTGVSGSGKSSLAFDTIYAEGQRRYVESLSAYARQFLELMQKPKVEFIGGLSPAIAINQKSVSHNPRSTVSTVTEINDYLRLLYARVGTAFSPKTRKPITSQSIAQMVDAIKLNNNGNKIYLLAPIVRNRKGEHKKEILALIKKGFQRIKVNNELYSIDETPIIDKNSNNTIEVVVDRIIVKKNIDQRLAESIETCLSMSDGLLFVEDIDKESTSIYSSKFACPVSGFTIDEIEPRLFSFNSPSGACSKCDGLGEESFFDEELIIPDDNLSINEGAIKAWSGKGKDFYNQALKGLSAYNGMSLDTIWKNLSKENKEEVLHGSGEHNILIEFFNNEEKIKINKPFIGVIPSLKKRILESTDSWFRDEYSKYQSIKECQRCQGYRLNEQALSVKIDNKNIAEISMMTIINMKSWISNINANLTKQNKEISSPIIKEISLRLEFLIDVGLDYLTLNRKSNTLSGGESQRIRLASQIGSGLTGILYVLDEPSIGLHQRDNIKLIETLKNLRNLGNTVIVVEHDEEAMLASDYIVDIGIGAGINGGNIIAQGTPKQICSNKKSLTGNYLSGRESIIIPQIGRKINKEKFIYLEGANLNNLKNINLKLPVGNFISITGVSGSGKSSLIVDTLLPALQKGINNKNKLHIGKYTKICGLEYIDKIVEINQAPIGRTPRSNPATYTGAFTPIREYFAQSTDAKIRGYKPGRFSFNVKGGRCEACQGDGIVKIEMHFLPDIYVECDECKGKRYNRETLEITLKNKNISEILDMTIEESILFFKAIPSIYNKVKTLSDVGLDYIKLGQAATTLSGGEAQRIKLSKELAKRATGNTIYILDEPTTGLHFEDVKKLLHVLNSLVNQGNTVIVIEHNLDIIKSSDWIVDLGPEGGDMGGSIVVEGTPQEIIMNKTSYTAKYLKKHIKQ